MKSFEEYLEIEITKPIGDHYDPNGNSARATVYRMHKKGILSALKHEVKEVSKDVKAFFTVDFEGFDTSIGWFLQFVLLPIMIPLAPFARTYTRYKSARSEYYYQYQTELIRARR